MIGVGGEAPTVHIFVTSWKISQWRITVRITVQLSKAQSSAFHSVRRNLKRGSKMGHLWNKIVVGGMLNE